MVNVISKARLECQFSLKALHNLVAARAEIDRLLSPDTQQQGEILSALFLSAVVKYCRPFIQTETPLGKRSLPLKRLKKTQGFDHELHKHLLYLRHRLLAHDDLEEVPPRIVSKCMNPHGSKISIPIEVSIRNKALSHPKTDSGLVQIGNHIAAAIGYVHTRLDSDLATFRKLVLDHPDDAEKALGYHHNYGPQVVPATGLQGAGDFKDGFDLHAEPFLNPQEPDFASAPDGYHYGEMTVSKKFYGPEEFKLENGETFTLTPRPARKPKMGQ